MPGRHLHWMTCCVLAIVAVRCLVPTATAEDRISQYFDGLRARRMFVVAEGECLRRLAGERITPKERADLTIELSKTYAAHAAFSTGEERQDLWEQAEAIVAQLLTTEVSPELRVLLETQRGMVPAARGAQLRWQGELFPLDEQMRSRAASVLRDALEQLQPLPAAIEAASRTSSGTAGVAPARLYQLRRTVDFAIATASLDLAKVLAPGADRTEALLTADQQFDALTNLSRPDDVAWQSRVHRLEILRLRGETDRLAGHVNSLIKLGPPTVVADAAVAVLVRSHLDQNHPDEALELLEQHRRDYGLNDEELQSLIVSSILAARHIAQEKGDAALGKELTAKSESIAKQLSGPWGMKSRLELEESRERDLYGPELAASLRDAQWAWQNGDVDGAIVAFGRAATQAHQQGRAELAVELAFKTASAQVEAGRYDAARRSLSDLLRAYPDSDRAADADLLRAYTLGRLFEATPTDETKAAYRDALATHRTTYADRPTAVEATWMLARLTEYEQDWEQALELLAAVPLESEHHSKAVLRSAILLERLIDAARQRGEATDELETRAVNTLSQAVEKFPPPPSRLTASQAEVAKRLAKLLLHRDPPDFGTADELLERVMAHGQAIERETETPDAKWQSLMAGASQLRIISLAGQGRLSDARQLLEQVAAAQPERLLAILNGLSEAAADVGFAHRAGIGRMQLELAEQLKTQLTSLPDDQQRSLDLSFAQANAALGQWQSAARVYEELLWKQPKDQEIVKALAALYEECGSASCLRQAVKQWRTLESLQRKGSVEWLESRYHMASVSHQLGDDEIARKLIGITRVLYPDLGNPTLAEKYATLSKEVGQ